MRNHDNIGCSVLSVLEQYKRNSNEDQLQDKLNPNKYSKEEHSKGINHKVLVYLQFQVIFRPSNDALL